MVLKADLQGQCSEGQKQPSVPSTLSPRNTSVPAHPLLPHPCSSFRVTAWFRRGWERKLQPPPHSEVRAKPQTGLNLSGQCWLQDKGLPGLAQSSLSAFLCPHSCRAPLHLLLPRQLAALQPLLHNLSQDVTPFSHAGLGGVRRED